MHSPGSRLRRMLSVILPCEARTFLTIIPFGLISRDCLPTFAFSAGRKNRLSARIIIPILPESVKREVAVFPPKIVPPKQGKPPSARPRRILSLYFQERKHLRGVGHGEALHLRLPFRIGEGGACAVSEAVGKPLARSQSEPLKPAQSDGCGRRPRK